MNWFQCRCFHCGRVLAIASHGVCSRCLKNIAQYSYCGCCGVPLPENARHCGHCLVNEPKWDRMVIVGSYQKPLADWVHRFKFRQQFWLDNTLSRLLLLAVMQARRTHQLVLPEVICPVPLHHWRQWSRGYNQSALLAKQLAKKLAIPYRDDLIQRVKYTQTQRGLNAKERRKNMKNAFKVNELIQQIGYRSVALVDDVMTTGATLNEISLQLRHHGITEIQVWGLCRA